MKCYYDNSQCAGHLWQCQTCREWFCQTHSHVTDKGNNVECVACERERNEKDDKSTDNSRVIGAR